ANRSPSLRLRF
nr:FMRFamide-like peptide [Periplaneta americana]